MIPPGQSLLSIVNRLLYDMLIDVTQRGFIFKQGNYIVPGKSVSWTQSSIYLADEFQIFRAYPMSIANRLVQHHS